MPSMNGDVSLEVYQLLRGRAALPRLSDLANTPPCPPPAPTRARQIARLQATVTGSTTTVSQLH